MIRFFIGFTFYLRHFSGDITELLQSFLHVFVNNKQFELFEFYFNVLLDVINQLSLPAACTNSEIEGSSQVSALKRDITITIELGFKINANLSCSNFELFSILLNLLRLFPESDFFDQIKPSVFVSITTFIEDYVRRLMTIFGGCVDKLANSTFYCSSALTMKDLVFFTQEPVRLLIKKHEYRYCYMGLLCMIVLSSADKIIHCREALLQCLAILQNRRFNDADNECIGRFLGPFIQLSFECWGLVTSETIVQANIAFAKHLQRTRRPMNDLVYSFLNLVKSNYVYHLERVSTVQQAFANMGHHFV